MSSPTMAEKNRLTPKPQGVGGFDECWYPVALSSEVARGSVHGCEFLDGRVVVLRAGGGEVSVLSAYCRHLGADLADGDIRDDCIRCPFHHWVYDASGQCLGSEVGDRVPHGTSLFAFPTQERWGLIWAFNGREPTYNVPTWEEDESERCYSTIMVADYRGDPFLAMLNVIDVQHLRSLHGLDVSDIDLKTEDESFHVDMTIGGGDMGLPTMTRHAQILGTNSVVYSRTSIGIDMMSAATPYGDGRSRLYLVTAGLHSVIPAESIVQKVADRQRMSEDVIAQDIPVLERIRFRVDKVTSSDRGIVTFLQFVTNYPRSHPSAALIA